MALWKHVKSGGVSAGFWCSVPVLVTVLALTIDVALAGSVAGPVERGIVPGAKYCGVTYDCHFQDSRTTEGRRMHFYLATCKTACRAKPNPAPLQSNQEAQEVPKPPSAEEIRICVEGCDEKYYVPYEKRYEEQQFINTIDLDDGTQIAFNFLRYPIAAKRLVVHFHGNAEDVGPNIMNYMRYIANTMEAHVIAVDYPGYGQSSGDSTESNINSAMEKFLRWVTETVGGPQNVVVTAWSIGTGISSSALHRTGINPSGLVLMAPYSRAEKVVDHILTKHVSGAVGTVVRAVQSSSWWNTQAAVAAISSPVFVAHGVNDETCPYAMGEEVCEAAGSRCTFLKNPNGRESHEISESTASSRELKEWMETLPVSTVDLNTSEIVGALHLGAGSCRDIRPIMSRAEAIAETSVAKLAKSSQSSS